MLIGELVKQSGYSRDTIRFYEKEGLLTVVPNSNRSSYKNYSEKNLQQLQTIKKLKSFGFTLTEISVLLQQIEAGEASCGTVALKATNKIRVLDQKISELENIKKTLGHLIRECCDPGAINCPSLSAKPG